MSHQNEWTEVAETKLLVVSMNLPGVYSHTYFACNTCVMRSFTSVYVLPSVQRKWGSSLIHTVCSIRTRMFVWKKPIQQSIVQTVNYEPFRFACDRRSIL